MITYDICKYNCVLHRSAQRRVKLDRLLLKGGNHVWCPRGDY